MIPSLRSKAAFLPKRATPLEPGTDSVRRPFGRGGV